jgi:hypothetical protein
VLGFSQLLYARAAEDMQSRNWLGCHRRMFALYAGVTQALEECAKRINNRRHARFGVSRRERFEALEGAALKALPQAEFDGGEWKVALELPRNARIMPIIRRTQHSSLVFVHHQEQLNSEAPKLKTDGRSNCVFL